MSALRASGDWLLLLFSMTATILVQGARPNTWRRPVRAEFWRFLDLVCLGNLAPVIVAAALVGLALVAQGIYWLDQVGQASAIGDVIVFVMVREVGPLIVGLIALGTGGILLVGEISKLRNAGQLAALDNQGIDPFQLLVLPRVIAIVLSVFAHSVIFIIVAFFIGYVVARTIGAVATGPGQFFTTVLTDVGTVGYAILPAKAVAIGLTIGVVCSLTAMDKYTAVRAPERLTASGFMRAISGILLVSALLSLTL